MKRSPKINVLVTAVGAPPGNNAVCSLKNHRDLNIVLVDSNSYASGFYQFRGLKSYLVPPAREEEKYIQSLLDIARKEKVSVILPCVEDEILALSKHLELFEQSHVSIPIPAYDSVIQGTDKFNLNCMADELKIPHPKTYLVTREKGVSQAELGFPMILKPRVGYGARGFTMVSNPRDLRCKVEELLQRFPELILQEYIPGIEGSMLLCGLLYDHRHHLKASFQSRSLKTLYHFGGPATAGEPIRNPQIRRWTIAIMERIGKWVGPVNLEFKRHAEKKTPYLMDFNPRLWGYGSLAVFAGIDFPYLSVQVGLKNPISPQHRYAMWPTLVRSHHDIAVPKKELKFRAQ